MKDTLLYFYTVKLSVQLNTPYIIRCSVTLFHNCVGLPFHSAAIMTAALARVAVVAVVVEVTGSLIYLPVCSLKRRAQLW